MEVAEASAASVSAEVAKKGDGRRTVRSPINGAEMPLGRVKGSSNRVTVSIKQAIEAAIQPGACHPQGLAGWLIDRAKGSLGDRQIFASVVNKFVQVQLQASIDGGIKLELGWLTGRAVGTTTAQLQESATQVIELQQDSSGAYRISDPLTGSQPAAQPLEQGGQACADPHPPSSPGAGG